MTKLRTLPGETGPQKLTAVPPMSIEPRASASYHQVAALLLAAATMACANEPSSAPAAAGAPAAGSAASPATGSAGPAAPKPDAPIPDTPSPYDALPEAVRSSIDRPFTGDLDGMA